MAKTILSRRKEALELLGSPDNLTPENVNKICAWLTNLDETIASTYYYFQWENVLEWSKDEMVPLVRLKGDEEMEGNLRALIGMQKWFSLAEEAVVIHGLDHLPWRVLYAVKLFADGGYMDGAPLTERLRDLGVDAVYYSNGDIVIRNYHARLSVKHDYITNYWEYVTEEPFVMITQSRPLRIGNLYKMITKILTDEQKKESTKTAEVLPGNTDDAANESAVEALETELAKHLEEWLSRDKHNFNETAAVLRSLRLRFPGLRYETLWPKNSVGDWSVIECWRYKDEENIDDSSVIKIFRLCRTKSSMGDIIFTKYASGNNVKIPRNNQVSGIIQEIKDTLTYNKETGKWT